MHRRKFVGASLMTAATAFSSRLSAGKLNEAKTKELYELREYEFHFGSSQVILENYLKNALIPSLKKYGVSQVGVFKEISKNEPAKLFMLIPYPSGAEYFSIYSRIMDDNDFKIASREYQQVPKEKWVYNRFSTSLLVAADSLPIMKVPSNEPRIFELRRYEGYNEDAVKRKIKMFNEGELEIFYKTKLNPVFLSEMIAGKNMPCLVYMLTFRNMEERDKNWGTFSADPGWKTMSQAPEYANTVSNIIRMFLEPTPYSGI